MSSTQLRPARRPRTAQAGALAASLVLLLTGCFGRSDDPTPSTTAAPASATQAASASAPGAPSTTSGAASSATAATPSAGGAYVPASEKGPAQNVPKPVMPEAMKQNDKAGAEAAVEYFWETVYYMQQTGDADPVERVSGEECNFCSHLASSMESLYRQGGWFTGTKPEIYSSIPRKSADGYLSTLLMNFASGTGYKSDGSVADGGNAAASSQAPWISEMRYDSNEGHWVITSMEFKGEASQ